MVDGLGDGHGHGVRVGSRVLGTVGRAGVVAPFVHDGIIITVVAGSDLQGGGAAVTDDGVVDVGKGEGRFVHGDSHSVVCVSGAADGAGCHVGSGFHVENRVLGDNDVLNGLGSNGGVAVFPFVGNGSDRRAYGRGGQCDGGIIAEGGVFFVNESDARSQHGDFSALFGRDGAVHIVDGASGGGRHSVGSGNGVVSAVGCAGVLAPCPDDEFTVHIAGGGSEGGSAAVADGVVNDVGEGEGGRVHSEGDGVGSDGAVGASGGGSVGQDNKVLTGVGVCDILKGHDAGISDGVAAAFLHPFVFVGSIFGSGQSDGLAGACCDVHRGIVVADLGGDAVVGQRVHGDGLGGVFYHAAVGREAVVSDGLGEVDTDGLCPAGIP